MDLPTTTFSWQTRFIDFLCVFARLLAKGLVTLLFMMGNTKTQNPKKHRLLDRIEICWDCLKQTAMDKKSAYKTKTPKQDMLYLGFWLLSMNNCSPYQVFSRYLLIFAFSRCHLPSARPRALNSNCYNVLNLFGWTVFSSVACVFETSDLALCVGRRVDCNSQSVGG